MRQCVSTIAARAAMKCALQCGPRHLMLMRPATKSANRAVPMSTDYTDNPQHWRDRAARMRALAVKMAGSQAAILINDLAVH